jgi:hypothetical protein
MDVPRCNTKHTTLSETPERVTGNGSSNLSLDYQELSLEHALLHSLMSLGRQEGRPTHQAVATAATTH